MKILILNWKDHHHPAAGGAEDFTYHVASRLVGRGHEVVWFTSGYAGAPNESKENGIQFVRKGSMYSVHHHAKKFLAAIGEPGKPDIVIDEVNTRPFFPARYLRVSIPIVNLIHQLAREVWFQETPWPVALIGRYLLEDRWLREIAAKPTITVSKSTLDDLVELGFRSVRVVPNGLPETPSRQQHQKSQPPLLVFIGRLTKSKRPRDALEAFRLVHSRIDCAMVVMGSGPLLPSLKRRYDDVTFTGRVPEEVKKSYLKLAKVILVPGVREGWSRVVLEGQAFGAIPIVYNTPGLRDAVDGGLTGVLLGQNTAASMSEAAINLLKNSDALSRFSQVGQDWAREHTYDKTTDLFEGLLSDPTFLKLDTKPA
jgi:glycosyltransferase involved in cell wall biosynthesis